MASPPAAQHLPRICAFDLDATLWYPEMYMLSGPPFRLSACQTAVIDRRGEETRLMGDSHAILAELATHERWADTEIAYVSRTDEPAWAAKHLQMFSIADGLDMSSIAVHHEIYPGSKKTHFRRIHERTKVDYKDMLFFDNESWNVREVAALGVVSIYTPDGMTRDVWRKGLAEFATRKQKATARR